jgi:hypothetical protein
MKGLALEVVWGLLIAIVAVLVYLALVTGTFKNAGNWFYCDVYMKIIGFFGGSDLASVPDQCKNLISSESKSGVITPEDNKLFSRELLAYIIACWNEAEVKGLYETHPCYELKLSGNIENVSEENVTYILIKEDRCRSIENSDFNEFFNFECGGKNQIVWSVEGTINSMYKTNISDAINNSISPNEISITESMIPSINNIKSSTQLRNFIMYDVPKSICNSFGSDCISWKYVESNDYALIKLKNGTQQISYAYFIDDVVIDLQNKGFINSFISDQTILLIKYNGDKEAVEVIG